MGEAQAILGGARKTFLAELGTCFHVCMGPACSGISLEEDQRYHGAAKEAEPGRPVKGGQRLMPSTAQAVGKRSAHYKYISRVNAREEESYFS